MSRRPRQPPWVLHSSSALGALAASSTPSLVTGGASGYTGVMKPLHRIVSLGCVATATAFLGGCAGGGSQVRLVVPTGHTSRIVRDAEVITLAIYEEPSHDMDPQALTIQGVYIRRPHGLAEPARWSVTAAGGGPRGPTLGLVVTLPSEPSGSLGIEADLEYDGRPQKLAAALVRTSVGGRRVWLLRQASIDPFDR